MKRRSEAVYRLGMHLAKHCILLDDEDFDKLKENLDELSKSIKK